MFGHLAILICDSTPIRETIKDLKLSALGSQDALMSFESLSTLAKMIHLARHTYTLLLHIRYNTTHGHATVRQISPNMYLTDMGVHKSTLTGKTQPGLLRKQIIKVWFVGAAGG